MKNSIKYIILLIVSLGLFSCSEDDSYSIAYVDDEIKVELVGSIAISATEAFDGDDVEFTYTLPQSFDVESTLEVTATSLFNAFSQTPNMERFKITIPAGTTTGTATFVMPNFDNEAPFSGISEFLSVSITGIALKQPPREDEDGVKIDPYIPVDDPYTMTSAPVILTLLQTNLASPLYMAPADNTLKLSLDWEGPYDLNDLDLYVFDNPFTALFESSESGDRFEGDFFNNPANEDYPDGDYIVEVAIWDPNGLVTAPISYKLVLTLPDGNRDIYEGTVDPAVGYVDPVGFTQTTDGSGNRTFTTYSLL
ncbi:hypothetical protein [Seonamhaeicola aphaedonensis]|uniref:Uncharacterized protein n=1 Tax=Seonamhaeicola aphaedonensis TaxID=1461338 RepID=A0A3D9HKM3_9FLAO|nr:hypothetical protein [Seonamhaeicola aphaedonensis]RED50039.1 hypothetical protein DFQ02_10159 [Seonamhaeicola aphaedonensis]